MYTQTFSLSLSLSRKHTQEGRAKAKEAAQAPGRLSHK